MKHIIPTVILGLSSSVYATSDAYQQPRLNLSMVQVLSSLADSCQAFVADTEVDHSFEISDHHQSFALSHQWSNGTHTAFISHSETGSDDEGQILAFQVTESMFDPNQDLISGHETMPLEDKIYISERHPSGIAWLPAPTNSAKDQGYLLVASQYEKTVRFRKFTIDGDKGQVATLTQTDHKIEEITDVWINRHEDDYWLILHDMDNAQGAAYKASVADLFQYGTDNEGEINIRAFSYVNSYTSPSNTGCNKSLGQNAQLVEDSTGNWYIVHAYTDTTCGANMGTNQVKAYPAYFNDDGTFSVATSPTPAASTSVGYSISVTDEGADGATGFRVTNDGRLVVYLGGQYASLDGFDYKTYLKECRSSKY